MLIRYNLDFRSNNGKNYQGVIPIYKIDARYDEGNLKFAGYTITNETIFGELGFLEYVYKALIISMRGQRTVVLSNYGNQIAVFECIGAKKQTPLLKMDTSDEG